MAIIATISKFLTGKGPVKKLFAGAVKEPPLARQTGALVFSSVSTGDSGKFDKNSAEVEGKTVSWVEYRWPEPFEKRSCLWQDVAWRFYDNGLVCFHAQMSNASEGIDIGDMQGHRIELRDEAGFLLGTWVASFFVRRQSIPIGFQATITEDYLPLKLHFPALRQVQTGMWLLV
jgi:hypothetical protein